MNNLPIPCLRRWPHLMAALLVLGIAGSAVRSQPLQTPRDDFWRADGPVLALAAANGLVYVGGAFTYVGPATGAIGAVAKEDAAAQGEFPRLDGSVHAIVADGAGGFYVGGEFFVAGSTHSNLVHILADRRLDLGWRPNVNGLVRSLVATENNLYVGGEFRTINGNTRNRIVDGLEWPASSPHNQRDAARADSPHLVFEAV